MTNNLKTTLKKLTCSATSCMYKSRCSKIQEKCGDSGCIIKPIAEALCSLYALEHRCIQSYKDYTEHAKHFTSCADETVKMTSKIACNSSNTENNSPTGIKRTAFTTYCGVSEIQLKVASKLTKHMADEIRMLKDTRVSIGTLKLLMQRTGETILNS